MFSVATNVLVAADPAGSVINWPPGSRSQDYVSADRAPKEKFTDQHHCLLLCYNFFSCKLLFSFDVFLIFFSLGKRVDTSTLGSSSSHV
jgi:hypothetical protein